MPTGALSASVGNAFYSLTKAPRCSIKVTAMLLRPLSNRVLIEPIEEQKTTESNIVIPETAEKERPIKGKVLAVGPGRVDERGQRIEMSVKEGDTVLFKKYGPDEVEIDGKKLLVAEEDDILAVIN